MDHVRHFDILYELQLWNFEYTFLRHLSMLWTHEKHYGLNRLKSTTTDNLPLDHPSSLGDLRKHPFFQISLCNYCWSKNTHKMWKVVERIGRNLMMSFCIALCVLLSFSYNHHSGFIDILDCAKQTILEWVSMINDLLGKVQPGWVIV